MGTEDSKGFSSYIDSSVPVNFRVPVVMCCPWGRNFITVQCDIRLQSHIDLFEHLFFSLSYKN